VNANTNQPGIRLGFIPLTDCAPLVIAQEKGWFRKHGLAVELVREPKRVLDRLLVEGHREEAKTLETSVRQFADKFRNEHGLEIDFDDSAARRLVERAQAERMTMAELCSHLFKDYQFGLSLIEKNTGQKKFVLNRSRSDVNSKRAERCRNSARH